MWCLVSGGVRGGVPRPGEDGDAGVHGAQQPQVGRPRPALRPGLRQEREGVQPYKHSKITPAISQWQIDSTIRQVKTTAVNVLKTILGKILCTFNTKHKIKLMNVYVIHG